MVNVGAQRLQANDRVDPYVAVYSVPAPSTVGDVVHVQWHGFLTPQFVQRILDRATEAGASSSIPLIGLTIHGSTGVPMHTPHRVPRLEGEDTASIILAPSPKSADDAMNPSASAGTENRVTGSWVMVESFGKWDSRFG